jgi:hypothetical protein
MRARRLTVHLQGAPELDDRAVVLPGRPVRGCDVDLGAERPWVPLTRALCFGKGFRCPSVTDER